MWHDTSFPRLLEMACKLIPLKQLLHFQASPLLLQTAADKHFWLSTEALDTTGSQTLLFDFIIQL